MTRPRCYSIFVCAALFAGCSKAEAPAPLSRLSAGVTIYAAQGGEVTDPVVDAFRVKNPGLKVQIIRGGMGEMLSRIRAAA